MLFSAICVCEWGEGGGLIESCVEHLVIRDVFFFKNVQLRNTKRRLHSIGRLSRSNKRAVKEELINITEPNLILQELMQIY